MEVSNGVNMNILNILESIKEDIKICAKNQECMIGQLQQIREKNQVKHQTSQFSCGDVNDLSGSLCLEGNVGSPVVKNNDSDVMLGDNNGRYGRNSDGESDAYNVFDKMPSIKCIQHTGSIIEYYDVFTSYHNSYIFWTREMGLGESCLVSLFMSGLQKEIKEPLRWYTLKTLSDAYVMAKLQEGTNEMLKNNLSKGVEKENNELAGYHRCCNKNVNGEETEGVELVVPSKEEDTNEGGVKDEELELNPLSEGDNNTCVVIGEKLIEFDDKDNGWVILNELVQEDGRSKGLESNNNFANLRSNAPFLSPGMFKEGNNTCDDDMNVSFSKKGKSNGVAMDVDPVEECCTENASGEETECVKSKVLDELCEERVEGIGMESKELVNMVCSWWVDKRKGNMARPWWLDKQRKNMGKVSLSWNFGGTQCKVSLSWHLMQSEAVKKEVVGCLIRLEIDMLKWPRRKKEIDMWKWPRKKKEVVGCLIRLKVVVSSSMHKGKEVVVKDCEVVVKVVVEVADIVLVPSMQGISPSGKRGHTVKAIQETTSCVVYVLSTESVIKLYASAEVEIVGVQGEPVSVLKGLKNSGRTLVEGSGRSKYFFPRRNHSYCQNCTRKSSGTWAERSIPNGGLHAQFLRCLRTSIFSSGVDCCEPNTGSQQEKVKDS